MTKEEEIIEMACQSFGGIIRKEERNNFIGFAKLIAEKSKKEQDEPVAWVIHSNGEEHGLDFWQDEINALPIGTFLYTTPQTKEWVGLTVDQIAAIAEWQLSAHRPLIDVIKAVEQALKEKNETQTRRID